MTNVRYTGSVPVMFSNPDREVSPGDVFAVPEDRLDSYIQRDDIDIVATPSDPADDPNPDKKPVKGATASAKTTVKTETAD